MLDPNRIPTRNDQIDRLMNLNIIESRASKEMLQVSITPLLF